MHSHTLSAPIERHRLQPRAGVYFAEVQGEAVIMDLARNRYFGLSEVSAALWRHLVSGAPMNAELDDPGLLARQIVAWTDAGFLSVEPPAAKLPRQIEGVAQAATELDWVRVRATRLSARALVRLISAWTWAMYSFRMRGAPETLAAVQRIPVNRSLVASKDTTLDSLVRAYFWLRRFRQQGRDDCFPRSVILAVATRRVGFDAQVCFGVQKFPFEAHAWLEIDGYCVNDWLAKVRRYTLIARF